MDLIEIILFIFPAYIANSAPVILSGWGPLDRNANFFGKRLFGDSKTIRGTLGGLAAGLAVGALFSYFMPFYLREYAVGEKLISYTVDQKLIITSLMVLGAILGDLAGSFFKRRLNIGPGEPLFVTDQLLFILTAVIFSSLYRGLFVSIYDLLVILGITLIVHVAANMIAHKLNLKKVPW
ncbi:MAG: CDP-2,3-bis-(O-geranylgeranyl)-sn-glycerol synthase [Candidatus Micrarchaeota archaeon]